ncbi:MAG: hypothetical protein H7067_18585 [Burkholderiales bacterium]|nr:hypothetical protein [Opitutaceae bacterium]
MKTKSNPVRSLLANAALCLLASTAFAGPGPQYWQKHTKPVTTFSEANKMGPDDMAMMQCKGCKTAMIHTSKQVGPPGKGHTSWFTAGSKHTCDECKGEITVVKGKTEDSMQLDCAKCGEGSVSCSMVMGDMKTP